jgi:predicted NBD/HSP70 family sugar kinase
VVDFQALSEVLIDLMAGFAYNWLVRPLKHAHSKPDHDKAVILAALRRFGPLSRVEIGRLAQLRPNTVSTLTRELLSESEILEAGLSNNPTGRKQVLLRLNDRRGFLAGVEFDSERIIAAAMDLRPNVLGVVREVPLLDGGIEGLSKQLFECVRKAIAASDVGGLPLMGVAIADPGLVDPRRGVSTMSSQISFWKNVPVERMFREEFGVEALVEGAPRCKAVAERVLGAGAMADDMVFVEYGAGIGGAVISEGRLLVGQGGSAAEFGHTHVVEGGPPCQCGSFGCLEAMAGSAALAARFRKIVQEGGSSSTVRNADGQAERVTGWMVLEAASAGDKICTAIVEEMGRYLGLGLANLVNLLNPSLIVLDRRLKLADPPVLDQLTRIVRMQALSQATENLSIRFGELGDEAGVLGAGLLVLDGLYEIPALKPPGFLTDPTAAASFRTARERRAAFPLS